MTPFDEESEAGVFAIARQLIQEHGDAVGDVLGRKIGALMQSGDLEQFSAWCRIRNAVAITLSSSDTLQ